MDHFIISSLDILGSILIYGSPILMVVSFVTLIALGLINSSAWITDNWHWFKYLDVLSLVCIAIGYCLRAASYFIQSDTLGVWIYAIAAGVILWIARHRFRKKEGYVSREQYDEQVRTGHADDDSSWNPNDPIRKSI